MLEKSSWQPLNTTSYELKACVTAKNLGGVSVLSPPYNEHLTCFPSLQCFEECFENLANAKDKF